MNDYDITKLPKWAQGRIRDAERERDELREERRRRGENTRTRVAIRDWGIECTIEEFIDQHRTIRFYFGDKDHEHIDVQLLERDGRLVLEISNWDGIAVHPVATNVIHVTPEPR